jgi:hypothetical protein
MCRKFLDRLQARPGPALRQGDGRLGAEWRCEDGHVVMYTLGDRGV